MQATSLLLVDALKQIASACCHTGLGLAAAGFLTTDFVDALLSPRFALGSTEVRIEALKVVCTVSGRALLQRGADACRPRPFCCCCSAAAPCNA